MGAMQDLLQEVPLSAVLRERVALAEQKYEAAMTENAELRRQLRALENLRALTPPINNDDLVDEETARVLVHLFRAEGDTRDVGITARILGMEKGVVQYIWTN
jgi:hypothetical protein